MKFVRETIINRHRYTVLFRRWGLYTRFGGILLHKFEDSDDFSLGLHDHPWDFVNIILWRGYDELRKGVRLTPWGGKVRIRGGFVALRRRPGYIGFHRAEQPHAVALLGGKPSWSLCFVGPRRRDWGFHTRDGWVARRTIDEV